MNIEESNDENILNESLASNEVVNKMTIGEYLRSAREEKNLSLKVISQHTKISVTILENIENNNFDNLPSKAYVIGFIKSYSKTISLDEPRCLQLLNEAYGSTIKSNTQSTPTQREGITKSSPSVQSSSSKESHSQFLTIAGVFAALVILFAIVIYSTGKPPSEDVATTEENIEQEINQTPLVDVRPQQLSESTPLTEKAKEADPEETPMIEEDESEIVEAVEVKKEVKVVETKKEDTKKIEEKKDDNKITLRSIPTPLYKVTNDEEMYTYLPLSIKSASIEGKQNIFINAVDGDTWITYKSDDDDIKKFVLSKGRTLLIRGDVVRIFLGNVHVARIFLNNKGLSIASRSGVKSLVFPQEKVADFKLPLFLYPKPGKVITSSEYEQSL